MLIQIFKLKPGNLFRFHGFEGWYILLNIEGINGFNLKLRAVSCQNKKVEQFESGDFGLGYWVHLL